MYSETMLDALARNCTAARGAAGVSVTRIAADADVSEATIRAFEKRTRQNWPKNIDRIVASYGKAIGKSPKQLWIEAAGLLQA